MKVDDSPSPACGGPPGTLEIQREMRAVPIGDWSLAGAQLKIVMREVAVLTCLRCDLEVVGSFDGDGRHATFTMSPPVLQ